MAMTTRIGGKVREQFRCYSRLSRNLLEPSIISRTIKTQPHHHRYAAQLRNSLKPVPHHTKMNSLVDALGNDIAATLAHLITPTGRSPITTTPTDSKSATIPTDIIETDTNYTFYLDVPGLSKSEIHVTIEEERTLVVKSNGKRKREDVEENEEGCKFLRMERRRKVNLLRKFKLPEDADLGKIEAKCENGVLVISVGRSPPPVKGRSVVVKIG